MYMFGKDNRALFVESPMCNKGTTRRLSARAIEKMIEKYVAKESVKEQINYVYPENKEKVFTETVDQFYEALRKRSYPVHQESYRKHYDFY